MKKKPHNPNELASKLKFVGPVTRCTVDGVDFVFVANEVYENLPQNAYLFSLWKQGYFVEVPTDKGDKVTTI